MRSPILHLHRGKPVPLYYQLETSLRNRLSRGEFISGDPFPGEADICRQYGVSRLTVRRALSALAEDGLIVRYQGKGTFVTKQASTGSLRKFTGSLEDAVSVGLGPEYEIRILRYERSASDSETAEIMSLSDKAEIYRLDRIRLSGGKPLALMTNYLPVDIGGQFSKEDIIQRPIMNLLENKLNLHLSQADQIIDATSADAWTALQLDIRLEAPLLRMVRMVRDVNGRMVNYVYILFRADRYAFRVCLKRSTINNENDWNPE